MNRRSRSCCRGTTLIEVTISAGVLAFVLLAFLAVMWSASVLSESSREGSVAAYDLQSAVEDTLAVSFPAFQTAFPDDSTLDAYSDLHLQDERITIDYIDVQPDAVTYELEITFRNGKGFTQTDSIVTRRAR